jgi:hypothetical protein
MSGKGTQNPRNIQEEVRSKLNLVQDSFLCRLLYSALTERSTDLYDSWRSKFKIQAHFPSLRLLKRTRPKPKPRLTFPKVFNTLPLNPCSWRTIRSRPSATATAVFVAAFFQIVSKKKILKHTQIFYLSSVFVWKFIFRVREKSRLRGLKMGCSEYLI